MTFLLTGADGQLGKEWVDFLESKGVKFTSYNSGQLDITDLDQVKRRIAEDEPDVVINCAAYTNVDKAESEQEKAFSVNESGVKNLVDVCNHAGIKFVHYSTDYVFPGKKEDQNRYPSGYDEDCPADPVNTYGKSKRAGEQILENQPGNWLLIRVAWLCGRYGNNFVKTMIRLGKDRNKLRVVDDQIGCPTFTFDVVQKTWQLIEMNKKGIYHVSSSGAISWADFAEEIFRLRDIQTVIERISSKEYPTEARRPCFSLLSTKKIKNEGLKPVDWKFGLQKLVKQLNS